MSQFNYEQYQDAVNAAQNKTTGVKIGFFKLANDGDEAVVRLNVSSTDDLDFATVHKPVFGKRFEGLSNSFAGISCLADFGHSTDTCPLCRAAAEPNAIVDKATKKVFVQLMVSYKDKATGQFVAPIPAIWERPAGFSRDLATKLRDYGDLKHVLLKITRIGTGKETRYSMDYAFPAVYKPEMIPEDFSAFANFKINKHSYWEKSEDEINAFLTTGSFPEAANTTTNSASVVADVQVASTATVQEQPKQKIVPDFSNFKPDFKSNF